MILERKKETLCEDLLQNYGIKEEEKIIEEFRNKLKDKVQIVKQLVEKNYEQFTNEELFSILDKFYNITIEENDILGFISHKNNREYQSLGTIPTTMSISVDMNDSSRIVDYWREKYQIFLEVALAKGLYLHKKKNLSKMDLKELIDKKSIVAIDYDKFRVTDVIRDEEVFDKDIIKFLDICKRLDPNSEVYKEEFNYYMEILKKILPKKSLLKDLAIYIKELEQNIYDLFMYSSIRYAYENVSNSCKEWYKNSDIKNDMNILTKRINSIKES